MLTLRATLATAAAAVALAVTASSAAAVPGFQRPASTPVVVSPAGTFAGTSADAVQSFLGMRYAQAPTGNLRWRSPQPVPRPAGVVSATAWGPRCAAPKDTNGPQTVNEDCLFINVQRPDRTSVWSRRPVLVWFHGGSNLTGGADQHDGSLIARTTGSIVVTMNYRLGVLGFLAHPALSAEGGDFGNYGFQDQQAALRWVQNNIRSFGGDPRQVTIGGESSGGLDVCGHLTSPGSRGLFSRAIIQSGSCASVPLATAQLSGLTAAKSVGCSNPATAAACLRSTPVASLLPLMPTTSPPPLVRDTTSIPVGPRQAIASGAFTKVPVLIGGNLDEGRTFTTGIVGWTQAQYTSTVSLLVGSALAPQVLPRYPWPATPGPYTAAYLIAAILADSNKFIGVGNCLDQRLSDDLASHTPVYAYEFAHRTGPGLRPDPAGYVWGAGHAAELPYLWPSFDNGTPIAANFTAGEKGLSAAMVQAWGEFVDDGAPRARQLPRWPAYNRTGAIMSLDVGNSQTITKQAFVAHHQCGFWDPLNADLA